VMDFSIGPHISVASVGMLNIPVEISQMSRRVVMWDPLVIIYIFVAAV